MRTSKLNDKKIAKTKKMLLMIFMEKDFQIKLRVQCTRSLMHLYRRNQPTKRGELGNDDNYNYSYNEFLRVKMSYLHNLPTQTS